MSIVRSSSRLQYMLKSSAADGSDRLPWCQPDGTDPGDSSGTRMLLEKDCRLKSLLHTCLLSQMQNPACWQESYNQSAQQSNPHSLSNFTTAKSRLLAGKLQSISAANSKWCNRQLSQLQNPACWQESYNRSAQQSNQHSLSTFTTAKSRLLAGKLQSISAAIQSTLAQHFHNCKIPLVGRKVTIHQRSKFEMVQQTALLQWVPR